MAHRPGPQRRGAHPHQSLIALDRPHDWKALEVFTEYGAWHLPAVARTTARLIDDAPGRIWHGYCAWAGDDTRVHRCSKGVWGTCTAGGDKLSDTIRFTTSGL